jgi:ABC-type nitrate/sulfonate/bicarbonate transport system permease component
VNVLIGFVCGLVVGFFTGCLVAAWLASIEEWPN